jgi:hypothetical protein
MRADIKALGHGGMMGDLVPSGAIRDVLHKHVYIRISSAEPDKRPKYLACYLPIEEDLLEHRRLIGKMLTEMQADHQFIGHATAAAKLSKLRTPRNLPEIIEALRLLRENFDQVLTDRSERNEFEIILPQLDRSIIELYDAMVIFSEYKN